MIKTKPATDQYRQNFDKIFRAKRKQPVEKENGKTDKANHTDNVGYQAR